MILCLVMRISLAELEEISMNKLKIGLLLSTLIFSLPLFANVIKPFECKNFPGLHRIKSPIHALDQTFAWDNPSCKIVATKSVFPRKNKNGIMQFEKGLQLFVYQNEQLKFICLPGWICKSWVH